MEPPPRHGTGTCHRVEYGGFRIPDDPELILDDPSVLYQFYPGDLVAVEDLFDQELQYTSTKLLELSKHPDRRYLQFKCLATQLAVDVQAASAEYAPVVARVCDDIVEYYACAYSSRDSNNWRVKNDWERIRLGEKFYGTNPAEQI